MPESHAKMVKTYLDFWTANRDILLDGEMFYKNYSADFSFVSSRKDGIEIGAVYSGKIAYLRESAKKFIVFNASPEKNVILECAEKFGGYEYTVFDCLGERVGEGKLELCGLSSVEVPTNGRIELRVK